MTVTHNGSLHLGTLRGVDVTIDDTLALLDGFDDDTVIGDLDGETITVHEFRRRLRRTALLPPMVPVEDRLPDSEWAEAVIVRGEAPYGRCPFCETAKGVAGCLNLCEMPAALAQEFTNGLRNVLEQNRSNIHVMEALGGCTCGPARLTGYATERDHHSERNCPLNPRNTHTVD